MLFGETVLGHSYWAKQEDIMFSVRDHKYTSVYAGHNVGKGIDSSEVVPTPSGFRRVADLAVGDKVFDENGLECSITFATPEQHFDCFRISFDDGTEVVVDEHHLWYVEDPAARRAYWRRGIERPGRVLSTRQLFDTNAPPNRGKYRYSVPVARELDLPPRDYRVPPYVLGVWLGDGSAASGIVANEDPEVWEGITEEGYDLGEGIGHLGLCRTVYGMITELREIGVLHNKHIPEEYFWGSREQRIALLQGLMDTDGSVDKRGMVSFCNTNPDLAEGVWRLVTSLGVKIHRPRRNESRLYGVRKKDRYRLAWNCPFPCFTIKRKLDRQRLEAPKRSRQRMITSIVPTPTVPTRCFKVDSPNSMFLVTDACIPTHNTYVLADICWWFSSCFEDSIVLTTASTMDQVKDVLWRTMRLAHAKAKIPLGGYLWPKAPKFQSADAFMKGFSYDRPDSVHGFHSSNILIVFDEAQAIQDIKAWEAFSSMMTSAGARWIAIGNPIYAFGPFAQTLQDPRWNSIHISCLDHPNVKSGREIIPGAVTREAIDMIRDHPLKGEGTLHWRTRIEGQFPELGSDNLIPRKIVDQCMNLPPERTLLQGRYIGIDPAEHGTDRTVIAVMIDGRIEEMMAYNGVPCAQTAKNAMLAATRWDVPFGHINFDCIGPIGAELKRQFQLMGVPAHAVHVGREPAGDWRCIFGDTDPKLQFFNRRAELHWALRRLFELQRICIPPQYAETFKFEACQICYGFWDDGRLYIESKDKKYRPRTGMSPDHSDAVILCLARDRLDYSDMTPGSASTPLTGKYDPNEVFLGKTLI